MITQKGTPGLRDENIRSILETIDVNTGQRKVLAVFEGKVIEAPNWRRDRNALIYNSRGCIYEFNMDTMESTQVDTKYCIYCNNDHVLSPFSDGIAVSHHTVEDFHSRIYIVPFNGGAPKLVTPLGPSYLHGWSPDGKTLAFCGERNGQYDIYTIPFEGGEETQLTSLPGLDDGPEYSPCGKYIWFNSTRTGLMQIFRMEADGSSPVQMTLDENNSWFPHVSPDGTKVAYITYKKGDVNPLDHPANKNVEIRMMSAKGGDYQVLARVFGGQGTLNVNSWSPDGTKLAFVSYEKYEEK